MIDLVSCLWYNLFMKKCNRCGETKPLTDYHNNKASKDGKNNRCIACTLEYNRERYANSEAVRASVSERMKRTALRDRCRKYGITEQQYEAMLSKQSNVCAVCKEQPDTYFYIDHCHSTGKVRGLLCRNCNTALGLFKDDESRLESAIDYLRTSGVTAA